MIDLSHAEMRNYCFQTFYAPKVNFNAVLCRESNCVTSFSFGSSNPFVYWSQNATI